MGSNMEVTKEDLNRVYDKMEPMAADIAEIKAILKMMPQPEKRPCPYYYALEKAFNIHINEQLTNYRDWKMVGMDMLQSSVKWIVVAICAYLLGRMKIMN